jgi:serpin B
MKRLFLSTIVLAGSLPAADSRFTPALNAFTADTYKQLAKKDGNLILSPFNIAAALSMVLAGARGQTAQEIQSVLHVHYDATYDADFGSMLAGLNKAGTTEGNQLLTANGVWLQDGFVIRKAYETTLQKYYQAPPKLIDFKANADAARGEINAWVEQHTKEKIKDLFPPGSLNASTRLVLASAIYFYGKWQQPFVPTRTTPAPFTLPGGGTVQTSFMNQTSHFAYSETPAAQVLEMSYQGTGIAFDILLPKSAGGLRDLEKSLTPENLTGWLGHFANQNVEVSIPKFRAESAFNLSATLSAMGMPTAFTNQADFSGIAQSRLAISGVFHKAFVDVSEQGTEAAAATGIGVQATAARPVEKPVIFRADHPFLFVIRDTRTGAVLFMGRLTNPH